MDLVTLFDDFTLLQILEHLDIKSITRFSICCKRIYVLAYAVTSNSPSVSLDHGIDSENIPEVLQTLTSIPTFMLICGEKNADKITEFDSVLSSHFPSQTHVVVANCSSILKLTTPLMKSFKFDFPTNASNDNSSSSASSSNHPHTTTSASIKPISNARSNKYDKKKYTVFTAALPDTICSSFYFDTITHKNFTSIKLTNETLIQSGMSEKDVDAEWELFLVFASPTQHVEDFIQKLQLKYPKAVIIGGICDHQVGLLKQQCASTSNESKDNITATTATSNSNTVRYKPNSIACIALRGRLPIHTIVSRGHVPITPIYFIPTESTSILSNFSPTFADTRARLLEISSLIPLSSHHNNITSTISNSNSTVTSSSLIPTDILMNAFQAQEEEGEIFMIGTRYQRDVDDDNNNSNMSENYNAQSSNSNINISSASSSLLSSPVANTIGFDLQPIISETFNATSEVGSICIQFERNSNNATDADVQEVLPNQLQVYMVTAKSCEEDINQSLKLAKKQFSERGNRLLGSLLFTCSGRGPAAGFFDSRDYDAEVFRGLFPTTPLLGCYVNGEIGPQLQAGVSRRDNNNSANNSSSHNASTLFATSATQCSVQGFTAVFCFFVVPPKNSLQEMMTSLLLHAKAATFTSAAESHSQSSSSSTSLLENSKDLFRLIRNLKAGMV